MFVLGEKLWSVASLCYSLEMTRNIILVIWEHQRSKLGSLVRAVIRVLLASDSISMIRVSCFWIAIWLVDRMRLLRGLKICEKFTKNHLIVPKNIKNTKLRVMITNLFLEISISESLFPSKQWKMKSIDVIINISGRKISYYRQNQVTLSWTDTKRVNWISTLHISMMIIQMFMIHLKREEYLLGVIESYMKNLITAKVRLDYCITTGKSHTLVIIGQSSLFLICKCALLISRKRQKLSRNF